MYENLMFIIMYVYIYRSSIIQFNMILNKQTVHISIFIITSYIAVHVCFMTDHNDTHVTKTNL